MQISILQCLLLLLLLLLPVFIIYVFALRRLRQLLLVAARTLLVSGLVGLAVWLCGRAASGWVDALVVLVLVLATPWVSLRRARAGVRGVYIPLLAGIGVSTLVVGSYCYFLVLGQRSMAAAHVLLPLSALLLGASASLVAHGLHGYYMGLRHHHELYLYLLGNGATHREALHHLVRRGFQAALQPMLRQLSEGQLMAVPVITLALLMAGCDALTAVAMQMLWLAATLAHTMLALLVALIVARKYGFDPYHRLRN